MDPTALFKLSYGLYVVGVKKEPGESGSGLGGCIVDSVAQVSAGEAPLVAVSVMKDHLTNEQIHKERELTLSVLPADVAPFVIGNFGFQSARTAKKWENVPHSLEAGLPVLEGALAWLRLKVESLQELPTHTLFLCSVADSRVNNAQGAPLIYGDYRAKLQAGATEAFKKFKETGVSPCSGATQISQRWICRVCGHIYEGDVPFEELPEGWKCPVCGVGKDQFDLI